ncbi:MAG: hypothetical protein VX916_00630 [Planctomycetota bacterium]|nr:hypothetical protein [Planctomycetota bacterium]
MANHTESTPGSERGRTGRLAAHGLALLMTGWGLVIGMQYHVPLAALWGVPKSWPVLWAGVWTLLAALALLAALRGAPPLRRGPWPEQKPLAGLLLIVGAGALAYLFLLQPVRGPIAALHFGFCGGVFALGSLLAKIRPDRKARSLGSVLELFLTLAVIGAFTGEITLRGLARVSNSPLLSRQDDGAASMLARYRMQPGTIRYGYPANSMGDYDDEPGASDQAGSFVVAIGDSFSNGVVPLPFHFTSVAESAVSGLSVYNMGAPAIGPDEYLHLIRNEIPALGPAAVVVNLFIGNDLDAVKPDNRPKGFLWDWLDKERWLLFLVPTRLSAVREEEGLTEGEINAFASHEAGVPLRAPVEELEVIYPWLTDVTLEESRFAPRTFLEVEHKRAAASCLPDPPWLAPLKERLLAMNSACAGTPFGVMLIPDEFQVEDALWKDVASRDPDLGLVRTRPQDLLVPFLNEQGIPVLDLLPLLRAVPPLADGKQHLFHMRDTHLNARGNRVVGLALSEFVVELVDPSL